MVRRVVRHVVMGSALIAVATTALAQGQTVRDSEMPETNLDIPQNLQIFGKVDPNIRKATAIVNDSVITATDVDQRMALILAANSIKPTAEDLERLRLQVLRQLIDETLQIQQAKTADITITTEELDQSLARVAGNFKMTAAQFRIYLREKGSSERSIRRQIEGELAWQRYLRRRIEPLVNVGDEEVKAIIKRIELAKGTDEYHLSEIYLSATPDRADQVFAQTRQILEQIQQGKAPFGYFARNFSEASTKATNGDLDWVRLATLPDALANSVREMQVGQVAGPVQVPGGFSILYLQDKRQVLMADPRDAKLSLKQMTVNFRNGVTQTEATARTADFANALKSLQGCGSVEKVAAGLGAEVVSNDTITIRQLPPALQSIMLNLQVGQATPPFGSPGEGVRSLVLCGRDDPQTGALPSADQIQGQLEQERVNLRAQTALRDLRRDAVIEYR